MTISPSPTARLEILCDALGRGHACWWRPRGSSMRPVIDDGDRILIAPARALELRRGDIVQYRVSAGTRVHRLLGRRRGPDGQLCFALAGDNDAGPPDIVFAADLIGRAVAVERDGRVVRLDSAGARLEGYLRVLRHRLRARGAPRAG